MPRSENPLQKPLGRPLSVTPAVKVAVCEHVAKHGWTPGAAAARAGCAPSTLWKALHADPDFVDALEMAKGVFLATLEAEAHRRAVTGVETVKGIDAKGKPIMHTVYSDPLLIKLMVANGPEKHGHTLRVDKRVSGTVNHEHSARIDLDTLGGEDRAALRGVLQRRRITAARGEGGAQDVPSHDDTPQNEGYQDEGPMARGVDDDDVGGT